MSSNPLIEPERSWCQLCTRSRKEVTSLVDPSYHFSHSIICLYIWFFPSKARASRIRFHEGHIPYLKTVLTSYPCIGMDCQNLLYTYLSISCLLWMTLNTVAGLELLPRNWGHPRNLALWTGTVDIPQLSRPVSLIAKRSSLPSLLAFLYFKAPFMPIPCFVVTLVISCKRWVNGLDSVGYHTLIVSCEDYEGSHNVGGCMHPITT